jgi:DNA-binding transcriptional LysR family regulator
MRKPSVRHVSLASLRAFEVVGRRGGISAAAAELNLTVSAVSHQMRELEQSLGIALSRREGRGIALTPEGSALLADLAAGFERIQRGVARTIERRDRQVLTVSCLPWFASRWLIPRLARFQSSHPSSDIRVSTTTRRVDLVREGFDCAIRYGPGGWPDVHAELLFEGVMTALVHRSLVEKVGWPGSPADLGRLGALYAVSAPDDWPDWLRATGTDASPPAPSQTYDNRELVMHAILQGGGIGIVERRAFTAERLAGDLIQPFPVEIKTGWSYMLVTPTDTVPNATMLAFREWLIGETRMAED